MAELPKDPSRPEDLNSVTDNVRANPLPPREEVPSMAGEAVTPARPASGGGAVRGAAPIRGYRWVMRLMRRLYDWVLHWADTRYGGAALFTIAFAESSFFPIPPDVLLIALAISAHRKAFKYAAICSVGSVLGGLFGYFLGLGVWASLEQYFIPFLFSRENFNYVTALYRENAFSAILAAAFTPIPYKVFTIAAGVSQVPMATLLAASLIGRSLRFFIVGLLIYLFGKPVKRFIDKYFDLVTIAFMILLVAGFAIIRIVRG